jgi:putative DNA primase/helicase
MDDDKPLDWKRQERIDATCAMLDGRSVAPAGGDDEVDREICRLARLRPVAYEHERQDAAERLGVRVSVLDRLVKVERDSEEPQGQGTPLVFEEPEPCAEPVDLGDLLDDIADLLSRHVILPAGAADAVALWISMTWAAEHADCAPILLVKSPMPRCGKTTLLDVIGELARRPLPAASITASALFRAVEMVKPTLIIDEGDAFLAASDELRGVINCGHTRTTAFVIRTVGDDHEPRRFDTFGPKVIAMIGSPAATILDRSIVIELRRRLPSESVERLTRAARRAFAPIRSRLARWTADHGHKVEYLDPDIPSVLNDRAADSWRPLLAIADLAGDDWPDRARSAAVTLAGGAEPVDMGTELLADVRAAFQRAAGDRMTTAELLTELVADDLRPWKTLNHGSPMSPRQLAKRLAGFDVRPQTIRLPTGRTAKGYLRERLTDAFARYLPILSVTPSPGADFPAQTSTCPVTASVTGMDAVTDSVASNPLNEKGGYVVTDKTAVLGGIARERSIEVWPPADLEPRLAALAAALAARGWKEDHVRNTLRACRLSGAALTHWEGWASERQTT